MSSLGILRVDEAAANLTAKAETTSNGSTVVVGGIRSLMFLYMKEVS